MASRRTSTGFVFLGALLALGLVAWLALGSEGEERGLLGRAGGQGGERPEMALATLASKADARAVVGQAAGGIREEVLDEVPAAEPRLVVRVFKPSGERAGHVMGIVLDADGAALGGKHPSLFESYMPVSPVRRGEGGEVVFTEAAVTSGDSPSRTADVRWVIVRALGFVPVVVATPPVPWDADEPLDVYLEAQLESLELTLDFGSVHELRRHAMSAGLLRMPYDDPWWFGTLRPVEEPPGLFDEPAWLEAGRFDQATRGRSTLPDDDGRVRSSLRFGADGSWRGLLMQPELFGTSVFEGPPVDPNREGRTDFIAATLEPGAGSLRLAFDPSVALAVPAPPDSLAEAPRPDAVMGVVLETGLALSHIAFEFGDGADFGALPKELRLLDQRVERIDLAGCAAAAFGRRGDGRLVCLGPASGLGSLATSALTQRAANAQETLVRFVGPSGAPMILSGAVRVGHLPGTRIMLEPAGEEEPTGYRFTAACGRPHRIVVPWGAFKVVREVAVGATDVRIELAPLGRLEVVAEELPPVFEAMTQSVRVTSLESGWTESFVSYTSASGMDLPAGDYVVELDNPHVFEVPGSRFAPQRVTIASDMTTTVRF